MRPDLDPVEIHMRRIERRITLFFLSLAAVLSSGALWWVR